MQNEVAITSNQMEAVSDQTLIKHLENLGLMKELSEGEKSTYLQICKAYNLNPFKREVHVSKYNGQMSIITGYETYIKRAERSGVLDGWEVKTEGEVMPVLQQSTLKAIITIYRKDRNRPFVWEVKFTEYMQLKDGKLNKFWQKSETMIKKVAMAQGFRLCFNDELGGMPYTGDEVETHDVEHTVVATELPKMTSKQLTGIIDRIKKGEIGLVEKSEGAFKLTKEQKDQMNAAVLLAEELKSWIQKLNDINTKEDADSLFNITPEHIMTDTVFITAVKSHPTQQPTA